MKITYSLPAALLAAVFSGPLAFAQAQADTTSVAAASATSAPAPQAPATLNDLASEPATIDHVVYLARLPAPADLVKAAEAQGVKIGRMDQTSDKIVVVYQYSGGRTVTFAYTLLSAAGASAPMPTAPAPTASTTAVQTVQPSTTVVYTEPVRTVYYYEPRYVRYYDPVWDFWTPLAVGVGLGWAWHGGGGHYYHHGGGHWHGGGGHWRH